MFTENIKKSTLSLLTVVGLIMCGCQNTENIPDISDSGISSAPQESAADNSDITSADAAVTEKDLPTDEEMYAEWIQRAEEGKWIPIGDWYYALSKFITITSADCSKGEISDIIRSLVEKNVLYYLTLEGQTVEMDWDNPITYGDEEITLYPVQSVFFPDIKSIYDFASSVYGDPAEEIYSYDPATSGFYSFGRLFFTEIDGKMYVNPNCYMKRGGVSFYQRTYIEITEQTEDKCSFTWHFTDWMHDEERGQFRNYYCEKEYTAVYKDGAWRLTECIW